MINLDHSPCKNLDYFIFHFKMVIYPSYIPFRNPDQFNPYSIYKSWSIQVKILISSHIWHYVYIEGMKSLKQTLNSSLNLMQYKVLLIWPHFQQICQPLQPLQPLGLFLSLLDFQDWLYLSSSTIYKSENIYQFWTFAM